MSDWEIEVVPEPRDPPPGSTFRAHHRIRCRARGALLAECVLGEAEVFERYPPQPFLARLSWTADRRDAARAVVSAAARAVDGGVHIHTNAATTPDWRERLTLLDESGFAVYQEKEGLWWELDGALPPEPAGLGTRSMSELGVDAFVPVVAACADGGLDRVDRAMVMRESPHRWAERLLAAHSDPADQQSWLLGHDRAGEPVGFVGLVAREETVGTIAHIGVLPDRRGRRISDQLLQAAHRVARNRGFHAVLSHTDVLNAPMLAAFARVGASTDGHPWHKWHHVSE